jgi:hypothetical protein
MREEAVKTTGSAWPPAEDGADGLAHRPHGEVAAEHTEQHRNPVMTMRDSAASTGNHGCFCGRAAGPWGVFIRWRF